MNTDETNRVLMQGADSWNAWRKQNSGEISFASPQWFDSREPTGEQLKGRNRVDFSGMDLSDLAIYGAFAEGLNLRGALFDNTVFEEGDFSRADFSKATFRSTRFNKTILTNTNFDGATFVNCNLNRVNLVGANFCVREIADTVVYGLSAWDLRTCKEMQQSNLVIENTYEFYSDLIDQGKVPLTVDDIELAQFVYYLTNHKKMRDTLNILNDRGVLLLGQFKDGGLQRLYSLREWFQRNGYMAMIFDFARPDNLSLTETVVTMAGLSKFVVVDLSGPSIPGELQAILTQIKKNILAFGDPYALFPDLADQTNVEIIDEEELDLLAALERKLPVMEQLYSKRIIQLGQRYATADKQRLRTE